MQFTATDLPVNIAKLPRDHRGFPVPWFVQWFEGKPDFRVMDHEKLVRAVKHNLCWVCGEPLGPFKFFVVGPMCVINKVSAEPPSHGECARFSAIHCPFLTQPDMRRNEKNIPDGTKNPGGVMIKRNPGASALVNAASFKIERTPAHNGMSEGQVIIMREFLGVEWFREGRAASRAEVLESIDSGLPLLWEMANQDGPAAQVQLTQQIKEAYRWLPK